MNLRRLATYYAVGVGVLMLGMWSVLLGTGQVPELRTAPLEVSLHLLAEGLTAGFLIGAGVGLTRRAPWANTVLSFALGMLLYTVINSAGYYTTSGDWGMVGMFGTLAVLTSVLGWAMLTGSLDETGITRPEPPAQTRNAD